MALTRFTGNSNGDTKADACQRKTPGCVESSRSPGTKLPSVRCKTADGGGTVGWSAARAVEVVSPTAAIDITRAKDAIPLKRPDCTR